MTHECPTEVVANDVGREGWLHRSRSLVFGSAQRVLYKLDLIVATFTELCEPVRVWVRPLTTNQVDYPYYMVFHLLILLIQRKWLGDCQNRN